MRLFGHPGWTSAGVFLLALGLRLVHVYHMSAGPLFADPVVDAGSYVDHATHLAAGDWLGRGAGPFWQPPLYPYILALVKLAFPDSFFYIARIVQSLIGAASCLLVYLIGRRVFSPVVGTIAAVAAALYGPLIFFDARLLPTGLATFLILVGLLLLIRAVERPSRSVFLAAGLLLGIASIAVATVLALIPLTAAWLCYRFWGPADRGFWAQANGGRSWVVSFLLGAALAIAPVTLRNSIVGEDAVLISYNGGVNFYIGNNADSEKTLGIRPGWEWEELIALPLMEGITHPSAKSSFFYSRAFESIRESPLAYIALLGSKTVQFWHGDELERNQEIYYWRKYSSVLAVTLWKWGLAFPFGLVSPLALVGLFVYIRRQGITLPVVFAIGYSFAVIAFFVAARYRLPVVPLLLLFAAYGGHWLWGQWRQKPLLQTLWSTAILGFFVILMNWPLSTMDRRGTAATHNDLGNVYLRQGRHEMALLKYQQAVQRDATYWQAWFNLGSLRALRGDLGGALPIFQRVLEQHPERADVWSNLAGAFVGLGDTQQAIRTLERALRIAPPRPDIYVELLRLYIVQRQYGKADALYHRALSEFPTDVQLHALHGEINH